MIFSQQEIAIVELYFAIKSHSRELNAFQQKYPGETAPTASIIILLVQRLRDTGSVADRKRSGRAFIMKTKVADVVTAIKGNPLKRPSVYISIFTKFISLLKIIKDTLGYSKLALLVTHHGTVMEVLTEFFDDRVISKGLWPAHLPDLSIHDFFFKDP
ncbi:DUF4817 domain-containing protein [Trichonephila clavipes]|nr:DUF4817 domain-containing protein [Trichonephila clavipes]